MNNFIYGFIPIGLLDEDFIAVSGGTAALDKCPACGQEPIIHWGPAMTFLELVCGCEGESLLIPLQEMWNTHNKRLV